MPSFDRDLIVIAKKLMPVIRCPIGQAYGLVHRVRLQGFAWDVIDWDALQGEDLAYQERLAKLEELLGRPCPSMTEAARMMRAAEEELMSGEPSEGALRDLMALCR